MEELRSTEILDKEIQNDARRKVEKILQKADAECAFLKEDVERKLQETEKDLKEKNEKKLEIYKKNLSSAVPLEKERFLVSFVQKEIENAVSEYLSSLSLEKKLELLGNHLKKYEDVLKNKTLTAYFYGLTQSNVKKVLDKKVNVTEYKETMFGKLLIEEDFGLKDKIGIILEADDLSVRVRLTLSELVSQLLNKYRSELCNALFEGGLVQ
ncbi:MAG: hypothetical protein IIT58_09750 [Treponema sp.]|nr:hypothetical protein [Treponema sp.]